MQSWPRSHDYDHCQMASWEKSDRNLNLRTGLKTYKSNTDTNKDREEGFSRYSTMRTLERRISTLSGEEKWDVRGSCTRPPIFIILQLYDHTGCSLPML